MSSSTLAKGAGSSGGPRRSRAASQEPSSSSEVKSPKRRRTNPGPSITTKDDAMFPRHMRRSPLSLATLAQNSLVSSLSKLIKDLPSQAFNRACPQVRKWLNDGLTSELHTSMLAQMLPRDKWKFPCLDAKDRLHCQVHKECQIVYNYGHRVVRLLFTYKTKELRLDLRRINVERYKSLARQLRISNTIKHMGGSDRAINLSVLDISGASVHSDSMQMQMEWLCHDLAYRAPKLRYLRLPVVETRALRHVSNMRALRSFHADRAHGIDEDGLKFLSDPTSYAASGLENLHLGVFKERHKLDKVIISRFFLAMKALKTFSLLDEQRGLLSSSSYRSEVDAKVLTYSVLRLAIINDQYVRLNPAGIKGKSGGSAGRVKNREQRRHSKNTSTSSSEKPTYVSSLRHIKVVDRQLKPNYLLTHCPDLEGLYLDWQEELSLQPFHNYSAEWFGDMVNHPAWPKLAERLRNLEVVLPAAHRANSYSLTLSHFGRMLGVGHGPGHCRHLVSLRLTGAGRHSPIPLLDVLASCPALRELDLSKTAMHVPDNHDVVVRDSIHPNLLAFRFVGDMSSLIFNAYLTRSVATYMPNLQELILQPESAVGYPGMAPEELHELTRLKLLQRLCIALSVRKFEMNMPELIFILKDFNQLRLLTVSWSKWNEAYDLTTKKILSMSRWLHQALTAENANIHLELSYILHPGLFIN